MKLGGEGVEEEPVVISGGPVGVAATAVPLADAVAEGTEGERPAERMAVTMVAVVVEESVAEGTVGERPAERMAVTVVAVVVKESVVVRAQLVACLALAVPLVPVVGPHGQERSSGPHARTRSRQMSPLRRCSHRPPRACNTSMSQ